MRDDPKGLENNLRLFPRYRAASSALPWLPVFFLFFLERVPLGDAVLLGSAYYFAVFLLEVPSGYCSDRFGRRSTSHISFDIEPIWQGSNFTCVGCAIGICCG